MKHTHYCVLFMIYEEMKVKVLCRNPDDYLRETKKDIHKGQLLTLLKISLLHLLFSNCYKNWFIFKVLDM